MKILDQEEDKIKEADDESDSDYSSPTPVELTIQESPDQGVLFN